MALLMRRRKQANRSEIGNVPLFYGVNTEVDFDAWSRSPWNR
jgi:hypothetical protein